MYEELVKSLRVCGRMTSVNDECIAYVNGCCDAFPDCTYSLMDKAADAIESLEKENHFLKMMQQQMVDKIPMDDIGRMAYATLKRVKA